MSVDIYRANAQDRLSLAELRLYHQIIDYRAEQGLAALPLSRALTTTAGRHVVDTRENIWPEDRDFSTLHDWSDARYHGAGGSPRAMWFAPDRLGTGYDSPGYEIAAAGQSSGAAALATWKASAAHDAILTETGAWSGRHFATIGIGLDTSSGPGIYAGRIFYVWFGEAEDDRAPNIVGTARGDRVVATDFADRVFSGNGDDTVSGGRGADRLSGANGADWLQGGGGDDRLLGGAGRDRLYGKTGDDHLSGGAGGDTLSGYRGGDTLVGGTGRDLLTGGSGADVFEFLAIGDSPAGAGRDKIGDFRHGVDHVDLSAIDADATARGNQTFDYIGRAGFDDDAGELRFVRGILAGDVNGDGRSDFQIQLADVGTLSVGDLIL